ncbi:tryptophan synthase subunit alpha [Streptomyces noursei]|uniref:tryptophan synthase subunit alpha n=1 Tax=Streptomyces noursei TaxID=1971 RepID=UPI0037F5379D
MPVSLLSSSALSQLLCRPRTALGVFVPAGLSDVADEAGMLDDLSRSGAALFEIGAPAADPVLDGPVIASAYRQALRRGTDLTRLQQTVEHASALAPTVVVAYWASLRQHGLGRFAGRLAAAGACGVMVPDLPADQAVAWQQTTGSVGLLAPARRRSGDFGHTGRDLPVWHAHEKGPQVGGHEQGRSCTRLRPRRGGTVVVRRDGDYSTVKV